MDLQFISHNIVVSSIQASSAVPKAGPTPPPTPRTWQTVDTWQQQNGKPTTETQTSTEATDDSDSGATAGIVATVIASGCCACLLLGACLFYFARAGSVAKVAAEDGENDQ